MAGWKRTVVAFALLMTLALAGCTSSRDAIQPARGPAEGGGDAVEPIASEPDAQQDQAPPAAEPKPAEKEEKARPEPPAPEQPPESPQAPPPSGEETATFERRLDLLLDDDFVAADNTGLLSATFTVEHPYQTLEVIGAYMLPVWAAQLKVTLQDPDGKTVVNHQSTDAFLVATGIGGSQQAMPMGYVYDVPMGEYTLTVGGAGTTPVNIKVRGHLGADMDFSFHNSVTGGQDHVSNYRGKVVLVDLMATWCGPCHKAMPGLKQIRDDYGGKVEILSIDVDNSESDSQLMAMRSKYGANWPFGFDDKGQASDAFGTGWIPSFGVIDQNGVLLFRHIGEMEPADLRDIIDYALEAR